MDMAMRLMASSSSPGNHRRSAGQRPQAGRKRVPLLLRYARRSRPDRR
ncbi:hypothetical protein J4730_08635 [Klebsiella pneumoniae]|uniref:Uncharacterized protein n=1 Tax=Klebsiella pneumoniae TaxID=573 RepID=A0A939NNC1_KLEPN|nr:hypothetical protein [Klebsiella pneumoniae]